MQFLRSKSIKRIKNDKNYKIYEKIVNLSIRSGFNTKKCNFYGLKRLQALSTRKNAIFAVWNAIESEKPVINHFLIIFDGLFAVQ